MRWLGQRQSDNIEDRRGFPARGVLTGGGIVGVIALLIGMFFGVDTSSLLPNGEPGADERTGATRETNPAETELREFIGVVLADTEDVWKELFAKQLRKSYREPTLVLFSGTSQSGCGFASASTGPFYCPDDQKLYLDLEFFKELSTRFHAAGDFAEAYVVAHEVGHHVQKQLGILDEVHARRGRVTEAEFNQLSVRLELQADFLAGVWARHADRMKNILEPGDVKEALGAASAVGDDKLQKRARGYVVPDSFTHGTSAQRMRWFNLGLETGELSRMMETFKLNYGDL